MLITDLARQNLIHPPKWMPANTVMLVTMNGSLQPTYTIQ